MGWLYMVPVPRNRKLKKRLLAWFRQGDMDAWKKELEESISKESKSVLPSGGIFSLPI